MKYFAEGWFVTSYAMSVLEGTGICPRGICKRFFVGVITA